MKIQKFKGFNDPDGELVPIEFGHLSFVPQRIFYVTGVPKDQVRGGHAHKECLQLLICLAGQIEVVLDDGNKISKRVLNPKEAVLVDTLIWDSQRFLTGNDVLLVLASHPYDKSDYIEDYQTFKHYK